MTQILFEKANLVYPNKFHALKDINLSIQPGEIVAVIGRSGSGKSTMLRTINKSIPVSTGKLDVLGYDVSKIDHRQLKTLRTQVAFIFQQFNLVKNLTVETNVLHGRLAHMGLVTSLLGLFSKEDKALAHEALKNVGLIGKDLTRVDELSGGQQQRVAIARALVQNPKILLADEPMASLDPKLSEQVIELLVQLNHSHNITVIMNLHVLDLAKKYAHRIVGLREGRVVYDGPAKDLDQKSISLIYEGATS